MDTAPVLCRPNCFQMFEPLPLADTLQVGITVTPRLPEVYVDQNSACTVCDGASWATAMHTVTAGLLLAVAGRHDSVFIAQGITTMPCV